MVRLSGPEALGIAARIGVPRDVQPRHVTRVALFTPGSVGGAEAGAPLDEALATYFPAPHSFTGEHVVELSLHGGSYVTATVLAALATAGARPALPGEFTERAVRHGKLDLLQAEAIADLIDARSRATHRAALRQLSGALSLRLHALREALLAVEALIAYDLDFPEEDDGPQPRARAVAAADDVVAALTALGATLPAAELGRDGVAVVLAGAPNAGKSSLLNALVGDARAIVSEQPGTTRDAIEVLVDAHPYPWRLVDTAGLREAADTVERLGVEVSERWLRRAQVVLVCGDDAVSLAAASRAVSALSDAPQVQVRTKADLAAAGAATPPQAVEVSAREGSGLDALRRAIEEAVLAAYPEPPEDQPMVTRARHAGAIAVAQAEVAAFRESWAADSLPAPIAATHLRAAIHALDELTGALDVEEVLERVFRAFCVGK